MKKFDDEPTCTFYPNIHENQCQYNSINQHCENELCHCFTNIGKSPVSSYINTMRFSFPRHDPPAHPYVDNRTNLEVAQDIIAILCQQYNPEYANIVGKLLKKDPRLKEVIGNVFLTKSEVRKQRAEYKKNNYCLNEDTSALEGEITSEHPYKEYFDKILSPSPLSAPFTDNPGLIDSEDTSLTQPGQLDQPGSSNIGQIDSTLPADTADSYHQPVSLNVNLSTPSLPYLPMSFISKHGNEPFNCAMLCDSGSTHNAISLKKFEQLGFSKNNINRKINYILSTCTDSKSNKVLGSVILTFLLYNIQNKPEKYSAQFLIIDNQMSYSILGFGFLTRFNFEIVNSQNKKLLLLSSNASQPYKIKIPLLSQPPTKDQPHIYHTQVLPDNYRVVHDLPLEILDEYLLEEHHPSLNDMVFDQNKILTDQPPTLVPNFENCIPAEIENIKKIINQFDTVWAKDKYDTGLFPNFEASIDLIDDNLRVDQKPRKFKANQVPIINEMLNNLTKAGVIAPANPNERNFSSNILIQEKVTTLRSRSLADKWLHKVHSNQVAKSPYKLKKDGTICESSDTHSQEQPAASPAGQPAPSSSGGNIDTNDNKPNKSYRLLSDYRQLNAITKPGNKVVFPSFQDIQIKLGKRFCFALDLSNSYHSIKLKKSDQHKSCFFAPNGTLYKYLRLAQGFVSSSDYQKRMLDLVFCRTEVLKYIEKFKINIDVDDFEKSLLLYSDDIICFVKDAKQHHQYLHLVLYLLSKFNLRCSLSKARFFTQKIRYLGSWYDLENQQTSICPLRLQSLLCTRPPRSAQELLSRLCSATYSSRFIIGLKHLLLPFYYLLTQNFQWSDFYQKCWNNYKMALILNVSCTNYSPEKHLILTSDSSSLSYSYAALMYNKPTDSLEILSLHSKLHKAPHRSRTILFKECESIAQCCKENESFIYNSNNKTTLVTDVIILQYLKSFKSTNESLLDLSLLLSRYPIQILTCPSAVNFLSDLYSRLITVKYINPDATGQYLNKKFWDKAMLISNRHISDILFPAGDNSHFIDCDPKISYKDVSKNSILSTIYQLFQGSNELQWLKLSNGIQAIDKDHRLWQMFKSGKKKLSVSDLKTLQKKYKLSNLDISAALLSSTFSENNSQTFLYSKESQQFVNQVHALLLKTNQHPEKLSWLQEYNTIDNDSKLQILQFCENHLFDKYNICMRDMSNFVNLVPVLLKPDSDICLKPSQNCLDICLKEPLSLKPNSLHILKLNTIILSDSPALHLEINKSLAKNIIFEFQTSQDKNQHCFNETYIFSLKNVSFNTETPLFHIRGFPNSFKLETSSQPSKLKIKCSKDIKTHFTVPHDSDCLEQCSDSVDYPGLRVTSIIPVPLEATEVFVNSLAPQSSILDISYRLLAMSAAFPDGNHDNYDNDLAEKVDIVASLNATAAQYLAKRQDKQFSKIPPLRRISPKTTDSINQLTFLSAVLRGRAFNKNNFLQLQLSDINIRSIYQSIKNGVNNQKYAIQNNILYKISFEPIVKKYFFLLVVPRFLAELILKHIHYKFGLHTSSEQLINVFKRNFYFKNSMKLAKNIRSECLLCLSDMNVKISGTQPGQRSIIATLPNQIWTTDIMHNLCSNPDNYKHILTIVDDLTGRCILRPLKTTSAEEVCVKIEEAFTSLSPPSAIRCDAASCFLSESFRKLTATHGVSILKSIPRSSTEQAIAESNIKHIRDLLGRLLAGGKRSEWPRYLAKISLAYNMLGHYNSPVSRNFLFFGLNYYINNSPISDLESQLDDNDHMTYLSNIIERREKSKVPNKPINTKLRAGSFCKRIIENKDQKVTESSKYLKQKTPDQFYISFRTHNLCRVINLYNLNETTVHSKYLRPLNVFDLDVSQLHPDFLTTFSAIKFRKQSKISFLPTNNIVQDTEQDVALRDFVKYMDFSCDADHDFNPSPPTELVKEPALTSPPPAELVKEPALTSPPPAKLVTAPQITSQPPAERILHKQSLDHKNLTGTHKNNGTRPSTSPLSILKAPSRRFKIMTVKHTRKQKISFHDTTKLNCNIVTEINKALLRHSVPRFDLLNKPHDMNNSEVYQLYATVSDFHCIY